MNEIKRKTEEEEVKTHVRFKLSALWICLVLLYIYADHFSLFRTGQIEQMMNGQMGPFPVTQASLLIASLVTIIPTFMAYLTLVLRKPANRWINIVMGVLFTLVNISNLIGETWAYYWFYGVIELVGTLLIIWQAWQWRESEIRV